MTEPTIFIVDDDEAYRDSLVELVASVGLHCECFASALDFLADRHGLQWEVLDGFLYPGHTRRRMHTLRERTGEALVQALAQAQQRCGIPLLTQARASALQAAQSGDVAQRIQAENQLSRAIMNLQAVAEAYPQLQANQNFLDLQAQLKALEEKIAYARQFYNDVVQKYNTKIEVVPTNIIAGLFHFEQAAYFQVDEADRQAPQVKF